MAKITSKDVTAKAESEAAFKRLLDDCPDAELAMRVMQNFLAFRLNAAILAKDYGVEVRLECNSIRPTPNECELQVKWNMK